jgi:hypothetical protein
MSTLPVQQCRDCRLMAPVAVFIEPPAYERVSPKAPSLSQANDDRKYKASVCTRCAYPAEEQIRWTKSLQKMVRRTARA